MKFIAKTVSTALLAQAINTPDRLIAKIVDEDHEFRCWPQKRVHRLRNHLSRYIESGE